MLKQYLTKCTKILRGVYRTHLRGDQRGYAATTWWDDRFFTKGVSDRQTIAADKSVVTAAYHYASVELLILRHLCQADFSVQGKTVCDLGSGSGHWIDF